MSKKVSFDENTASADELWEWYLLEYKNQNIFIRHLLTGLFQCIGKVIPYLDPSDHLLEVGCGTGQSSLKIKQMLSSQTFEVSEYDDRLVSKMIENNFPLKVIQESVYELKRADKTFDCVFLLEVLEHLADYEKALKEVFRVSRKYVVISVPNEPVWRMLNMLRGKYLHDFGNTPGHINHWSWYSLKKLISKYGDILHVYSPLPWLVVVAKIKD